MRWMVLCGGLGPESEKQLLRVQIGPKSKTPPFEVCFWGRTPQILQKKHEELFTIRTVVIFFAHRLPVIHKKWEILQELLCCAF